MLREVSAAAKDRPALPTPELPKPASLKPDLPEPELRGPGLLEPVSAHPGLPGPVPEAGANGATPIWVVLGMTVMLLLPFGPVGLAAAAMAGMFAYREAINVAAVLLAGALFLLSGEKGIRAQLWPAFKWGAGAALVAGVPLAILMLSPAGGWLERHRAALMQATLYVDLTWLAVVAFIAWRGPADPRRLGILLALVVGTSRLMMFPAFLTLGVMTTGAMSIILAPVALAGLAAGMLLVTLAGLLLAWLAALPRRHVPPRRVLAGLAALLAVLQLASVVFGLRGD